MGKKPVLTMVGLVWAGIALTGCNTCTNCRNSGPKYSAAPTFQSRNTKTDAPAPTMVGDAKSTPAPDATPGRLPDSVTSPASNKSTGIEQASGTSNGSSGVVPASTPSLTKPTAQSSLRPTEERGMPESFSTPPPAAPKPLDDGFSSRTTGANDTRPRTMPPLPVPSAPATTTMPQMTTPTPAAPPAPAPEMPGKSLPPISPFDNGTPPALPGK